MREGLTDPLVEGRWLVWYEGEMLPVTNPLRGETAVHEIDEAIAFVAGPTAAGAWVGAPLAAWDVHPVAPS